MINVKLSITLFSPSIIWSWRSWSFHVCIVINLVKIKGCLIYWNINSFKRWYYQDLSNFLLKCLDVLMYRGVSYVTWIYRRTCVHASEEQLECVKMTTHDNPLPHEIATLSFLLRMWYSRNKALCFAWVGNTLVIRTFLSLISCWDE